MKATRRIKVVAGCLIVAALAATAASALATTWVVSKGSQVKVANTGDAYVIRAFNNKTLTVASGEPSPPVLSLHLPAGKYMVTAHAQLTNQGDTSGHYTCWLDAEWGAGGVQMKATLLDAGMGTYKETWDYQSGYSATDMVSLPREARVNLKCTGRAEGDEEPVSKRIVLSWRVLTALRVGTLTVSK